MREEGERLTAEIGKLEAQQEAYKRERAALEAKRQKVQDVAESECPTCGTHLTPEHRQQVAADYDAELPGPRRPRGASGGSAGRAGQIPPEAAGAVRRAQAGGGAAGERRRGPRAGGGAPEDGRPPAPEAGRAPRRRGAVGRAAHRRGVPAGRPRRGGGTGSAQLEAEPFDDAAFERVRAEAAVRPRIAEERRKLLGIAERVEAEASRLQAAERDLAAQRETLASGASLAPIRQRLEVQEKQLAAIGFDAERFEAVQREMKALDGAPALVARLAEATRSLRHDSARLETLGADREKATADRAAQAATLAEVEAGLADRDATRAPLHRGDAPEAGRRGGALGGADAAGRPPRAPRAGRPRPRGAEGRPPRPPRGQEAERPLLPAPRRLRQERHPEPHHRGDAAGDRGPRE